MTKQTLKTAIKRNERHEHMLLDQMIAAGRGHEPLSQTYKKIDPLSMALKQNCEERYYLRQLALNNNWDIR